MKAVDVMTRNVISIKPNASVAEMAKLMLDNRISGLPVIDDRERACWHRYRRRLPASHRDRHRSENGHAGWNSWPDQDALRTNISIPTAEKSRM